jgi:hypothetical protein
MPAGRAVLSVRTMVTPCRLMRGRQRDAAVADYEQRKQRAHHQRRPTAHRTHALVDHGPHIWFGVEMAAPQSDYLASDWTDGGDSRFRSVGKYS